MKQFVLDYLAAECCKAPHVAGFTRDENGDLLLTLDNGKLIAIYVINRAIRLADIRERYEENTAQGLHTLYVVDRRMLPEANESIDPPYWMSALHTLMHGRIYTYSYDNREVQIRPLHLDWKWGGQPRTVEYGDRIDVTSLRADMVTPATKYIDGRFASATFGEGAFWKKRAPGEEDTHFDYSWRNWSFSNTNKRRSSTEEAPRWGNTWEDFERHYDEVEDESTWDWDWSANESAQRERVHPNAAAADIAERHYAMLGVSTSATIEEVKVAYRRKAREYHPDLHPQEDKATFTAKMVDINAAFEAILKLKR